ncbi:MAG TPA: UDP-N-acetylglucosamine--N-acetylmuramyl-(pentapeptide) pyrophosphoryl-undecaprenol N-acetylglucosamine transferase [Opitutaceae bacterium]|nr:UDP-N-acetylglucosamine--N-acetylmuramyl-(pentapeptide) pyrophosphoryl-undecaprenol N-acetylglucosamine transferase [Opitutaceae bacterium]
MSRFLISCGGTGGHLSPGIALAEGLLARGHDAVLLISRKRVDARLVEAYPHLRFERMPGTGFTWNPLGLVRCVGSQTRAVGFCLSLMARARPDLIVGFGGFTSAPVVLAGRFRGVPVALHECNRVPGLAVRTLGHLAARVYLPIGLRLSGVGAAATRHVGLPVRREIVLRPQAEARAALGFDPSLKLLAILGGSQGASVLNDWARSNVELLSAQGIQLFCVTGLGKGEAEVREIPRALGAPVRAVFTPFSDRIADVLSASDLVVSRAGAGTLAELVRCETPAILIPYPHAADNHQRANAAFFERQGGGLALGQEMLGNLLAEVRDVIFNDWLLRTFRGNLRRMDRANSLELMLADLEEMAGGDSPRRLAA